MAGDVLNWLEIHFDALLRSFQIFMRNNIAADPTVTIGIIIVIAAFFFMLLRAQD